MSKILFVAPLPPPIHGQSLASDVLYREISDGHEVMLVDMAKQKGGGLRIRLRRLVEVARVFAGVFASARKADVIYITISESIAGNIKDIVIYLLCLGRLDRVWIHLHGGAGMAKIMREGNPVLRGINALFIRRFSGVIILGESHRRIFSGVVPDDRLHIVPNFSEDFVFIEPARIVEKFRKTAPMRILYLSNLIPGKGFSELLDAYEALDAPARSAFTLEFAGGFPSAEKEREFRDRIRNLPGVRYLGIIRGDQKRDALHAAHLFCLPTYYPYEGQPISILEAYAAGCAVITTDHSGIGDIFRDLENGYQVLAKSPESIRERLEFIARHPDGLAAIAQRNRTAAGEKYRASFYVARMKRLLKV